MSGLFGKIKDFVGLNDPADYEYEYVRKSKAKSTRVFTKKRIMSLRPLLPRSLRLRKRLVLPVVVSAREFCQLILEWFQ